jgi:hypothetical protein
VQGLSDRLLIRLFTQLFIELLHKLIDRGNRLIELLSDHEELMVFLVVLGPS